MPDAGGYPPGTFVCQGKTCEVVRTVLRRRGWTENPDLGSKDFDLKWSQCSNAVSGYLGPPTQVINHFFGSGFLDNKSQLAASLDRCPACSAACFPRQYDLRSSTRLKKFLEDFVITQAELRLKEDPTHEVALRVLRRAGSEALVQCAHEWAALTGSAFQVPSQLEVTLRPFLEEYKNHVSASTCLVCDAQDPESRKENPDAEKCQDSTPCNSTSPPSASFQKLDRQPSLDGQANAWVVKLPWASKAEGITVLTGLRSILGESEKHFSKGQRWNCVVQKYIEKPLRIPRPGGGMAKTDLRLWTLVLSWNPLIAFSYDEVYFRIATRDFEFKPDSKPEKFAHVTNSRLEDNRSTKANLFKILGPEVEKKFDDWTWPLMLDAVRAALLASRDTVAGAAQEYRTNHGGRDCPLGPRAFELFGFDFALDEDLFPWLLEANASPDMLRECEVENGALQTWAENATEGLLNIVLSYHYSKTLKIPKTKELEEQEVTESRPERLFAPNESGVWSGHSHNSCYGQIIAGIPACLVRGFSLGAPYDRWLLIIREKTQDESALRKSYVMQKTHSCISGEDLGHMQVIRETLLPIPGHLRQNKSQSRLSSVTDKATRPQSLSSPSKRSSDAPRMAIPTTTIGAKSSQMPGVFYMEEDLERPENCVTPESPNLLLNHLVSRPSFSGKIHGKMGQYPNGRATSQKFLSRGDQPSFCRGDIVYQGCLGEQESGGLMIKSIDRRRDNDYRNSPAYNSFRTGPLRLAALNLELTGSSVAKSSSPASRNSNAGSSSVRSLPVGPPPKRLSLENVLTDACEGDAQEGQSPTMMGRRQSRVSRTESVVRSRTVGAVRPPTVSETLQRTALDHGTMVDPIEARVDLSMRAPTKGMRKFDFARRGVQY